jgi:hypothetical protein
MSAPSVGRGNRSTAWLPMSAPEGIAEVAFQGRHVVF